jgi:WS/DGAT/MGAT family acyltransferase
MEQHLTPLDATFIELERAKDEAHMHVGAIMVFDPLPGRTTPSLEAVRSHIEGRVAMLPLLRQRMVQRHPAALLWPVWARDEHFDICAHVRHAALPAPGDRETLLEWASDYWSAAIDFTRPLWEIILVEGLDDGRWALCTKAHHSLVDGIGFVDIGYVLLDGTADAPVAGESAKVRLARPVETSPGEAARRGPAALIGQARATAAGSLRALRRGAGTLLDPRALAQLTRRGFALSELIVHDELNAAPHTSLNVPIGARRRFMTVEAPLEQLKAIKRLFGGTVNDVVLTVVTGALRELFEHRGEPVPSHDLRAMVPVNRRAFAERFAMGNRLSSLFVELPIGETSPLERYARVCDEQARAKTGFQPLGTDTLLALTGLLPPVVHSRVAQTLYSSRLFNVTITNIPGPQEPLFALGGRLREVKPLVPLAADHALGVAVFSYDGTVTFGINADHDAVPDVAVFAEAIGTALDELTRNAA